MASPGNNGGNSPFGWLGLLKWSLAYSDGTRASNDDIKPMSKEDLAFLEKVMKEGIIDEGERMKEILSHLTESVEVTLDTSIGNDTEEKRRDLSEDEQLDLFQELRDIVEQIDYARAFMAIGGIEFLIGCATTEGNISKSVRKSALSVLATMCQNNPPVQLKMLELGCFPQLIQLFFDHTPVKENGYVGDDSMRDKVMQTLSASIRGHSMAEHIFCQNERGRLMLEIGTGMSHEKKEASHKPSIQLQKRSLFLLRAVLTADEATDERIQQFTSLLVYICTHILSTDSEEFAEIREISLAMLNQLLKQKHLSQNVGSTKSPTSVSILSQYKDEIISLGMKRIHGVALFEAGSIEQESTTLEIEEWQNLMESLAQVP